MGNGPSAAKSAQVDKVLAAIDKIGRRPAEKPAPKARFDSLLRIGGPSALGFYSPAGLRAGSRSAERCA
jgi:hypothetical protein